MGTGQSGGAGGRARTGGAAEKLGKTQKEEEKRQAEIAKERDSDNRKNAEAFVRNAAESALAAAKRAGSQWNGFSNSEVENITRGVYGASKAKQKKTGDPLSQADANTLVASAISKQMERYTKAERSMQGKMMTAYTKGGFTKPNTDFQRREIDRIIALAADNAMGRIYSGQGASGKLKSGTVTPNFLKKGLQQAISTLGTSVK